MQLLSVESIEIEGQKNYFNSAFPRVIQCTDREASFADAIKWVENQRDCLLNDATRDGAVLLRGFPVRTAEDFDLLIGALGLPNFPYERSLSNAVRINRTPRVFSANEAPPEVQIFFHHEMAQTPLYPRWIFFNCEIAAEQGGATPLCRSDVLLERLETNCPSFIKACEEKGLRYTNVMPTDNDANSGMGRSWKSTLGVKTRQAAESRLRELNYTWEWIADDCLKATTPALPAVVQLEDGRRVFFNQLIAAFCGWKDTRNDPSKAICHGDGTPLDTEAVKKAVELSNQLAFDLQWQAGDVVIVDNMVTMHARRSFVGTRKVLASLARIESNTFASPVNS